MIKNYIFFGPPGIGKGTLATLLAKRRSLVHISTGEIFRQQIARKTSLGLRVEQILAKGDYVDDATTNAIVLEALLTKEARQKGVILDGYPRTNNQALFLKNNQIKFTKVVLLSAPESVVIKRLLNRGRGDDNASTIKYRIDVYKRETKSLITFYKSESEIVEIDASGSIEQNYIDLTKALE